MNLRKHPRFAAVLAVAFFLAGITNLSHPGAYGAIVCAFLCAQMAHQGLDDLEAKEKNQ